MVVPKALRQAVGLLAGAEVEMRASDGRIEMEPAPLEVRFERQGGLLVAVPVRPVPTMPASVAGTDDRVPAGSPPGSRPQGAMTRFVPDTSCLVAAVCSWHEHHEATAEELARRSKRREEMVAR